MPGFVTLPPFGSGFAFASAHFQHQMPCRIGGSRLNSIKPLLHAGVGSVAISGQNLGHLPSLLPVCFLMDHSVFGCVFGDGVKQSLVGEETTQVMFHGKDLGLGCCSPVFSALGSPKAHDLLRPGGIFLFGYNHILFRKRYSNSIQK